TVATSVDPATPLDASLLRAKLALARWVTELDTAVGLSIDLAQFELKPRCTAGDCASLFTISGGGLEAGAQWIPRLQDFRVGAALASPIRGGNVVADACAGMETNCDGFILPQSVVEAWRFVGGVAYREGDTRWNQAVGGNYFR